MIETTTAILIVTGITQALKMAFKTPSRFTPLISIITGILLMSISGFPIQEIITVGIVVGLSSSGLYDFGKKTLLNKK